MRRAPRVVATAVAAALVITGLGTGPLATAAAPAPGPSAPGAPGAMSHFGLARKDCLGTARNSTSKVWFTVADGVVRPGVFALREWDHRPVLVTMGAHVGYESWLERDHVMLLDFDPRVTAIASTSSSSTSASVSSPRSMASAMLS